MSEQTNIQTSESTYETKANQSTEAMESNELIETEDNVDINIDRELIVEKRYRRWALLTVLFDPLKTYEHYASHPTKWIKMLLMIVASGVIGIITAYQIITNKYLLPYIEATFPNMDLNLVSSSEFQQFIMITMTGRYVFGLLISILLMSALVYFVLKLLKEEIMYQHLLAIVVLAQMPILIGWSINLALVEYNTLFSPITSVGYAFQNIEPLFLLAVLNEIDLFSIWSVVLIAIGLRIFSYVSFGRALIVCSFVWLIAILLSSGLSVALEAFKQSF